MKFSGMPKCDVLGCGKVAQSEVVQDNQPWKVCSGCDLDFQLEQEEHKKSRRNRELWIYGKQTIEA